MPNCKYFSFEIIAVLPKTPLLAIVSYFVGLREELNEKKNSAVACLILNIKNINYGLPPLHVNHINYCGLNSPSMFFLFMVWHWFTASSISPCHFAPNVTKTCRGASFSLSFPGFGWICFQLRLFALTVISIWLFPFAFNVLLDSVQYYLVWAFLHSSQLGWNE